MNANQRQEVERKIVRHLIRTMKAKGWIVSRICDGGEPDEDTLNPNETEAMDAIFAVDEARITFRKEVPTATPIKGECYMNRNAYIVLGNDGYDCIADYSCSNGGAADDFEAIMDSEIAAYCEKMESEHA